MLVVPVMEFKTSHSNKSCNPTAEHETILFYTERKGSTIKKRKVFRAIVPNKFVIVDGQ